MKKQICILLSVIMLCMLTACGGQKAAESSAAEPSEKTEESSAPEAESAEETEAESAEESPAKEAAEWTREGYFQDTDENMLSVTWMELDDEKGWYVGCMLGEENYGGMLPQVGNTLAGTLPSLEGEEIKVVVSEEGEDGLAMEIEGGETYHFTVMDLPDATIFVNINTEGNGNIEYAEGETAPEIDEEYPYQSAQINLAEPTIYSILAWPAEGWKFVKWTKDGEDFSEEALIKVELAESAEFVAVFEEDENWVNPYEDIIGEYVCDRARAQVSVENGMAYVLIDWGGSATEVARWNIYGKIDPETLTVQYSDCVKAIYTYNEDGDVADEVVEYEDGSGTVTFSKEGPAFTWHDDKAENEDMVFEWAPSAEE